MRLLIVEDNQDHAELLIETLHELCAPLHLMHELNGEEALANLVRLADSHAALPQFILLDIKMPRMNGIEALTALKQHPILRTIPVGMLSTSSSASEMELCLRTGAVSYIIKPLAPGDFEQKIRPYLPHSC